jgi:hypothetical protein
MREEVRNAVFGNVGTIVAFRIGVEDADFISKQMAPIVNRHDLVNIEKYNAYIRMLVDNQPLRAFNMHTFPPAVGSPQNIENIKEFSRFKYGVDQNKIESEILKRSNLGSAALVDNPPMERSL